ncbi:ESPR domain-containing protein [Lonepinella sp. BR2474]|uniref:ESPR domain-containing protein n=1 Tax=Lonepinella sp. BR2474 TaxID=3434548 RepID=UPI003F6DACA1
MNKIFKVIWNHSTQSFVVVSELSKSKGKSSSSTDKRTSLKPAVLASLIAAWGGGSQH